MTAGVSKARRDAIAERDGGYFCWYCSRPLVVGEMDPSDPRYGDQATVDHIIPRKRGGKNNIDNLVLSCRRCNSRKGARMWAAVRLIDPGWHLMRRRFLDTT